MFIFAAWKFSPAGSAPARITLFTWTLISSTKWCYCCFCLRGWKQQGNYGRDYPEGISGQPLPMGPPPGIPKDNSPLREKFGSFLCHKEKIGYEGWGTRATHRLLALTRASQDGSGFSCILSMLADSTGTQEKRRLSFPDIEDEEKFLWGWRRGLAKNLHQSPLGALKVKLWGRRQAPYPLQLQL